MENSKPKHVGAQGIFNLELTPGRAHLEFGRGQHWTDERLEAARESCVQRAGPAAVGQRRVGSRSEQQPGELGVLAGDGQMQRRVTRARGHLQGATQQGMYRYIFIHS